MITAAASLSAMDSPVSTSDPSPIVLVNESCTTHLRVTRYRRTSPLDERHIEITPEFNSADTISQSTWLAADFTIIDAQRLIDTTVKRPVLAHGRYTSKSNHLDTTHVHEPFTIDDDWTRQLNSPPTRVWSQIDNNLIATPVIGNVLRIGSRANRSSNLVTINNTSTYVLTTRSQRWTVADALTYLNAIANLQLNLTLIPTTLAQSRLTQNISLDQPLRKIFKKILMPTGLIIQRELSRTTSQITERRVVHADQHARPIRLPISKLGGTTRITSQPPFAHAQQTLGTAEGWLIESTFDLTHGWDAALENQTSSNYSRSSNPNFDLVADVYRHWILNEDHAYPQPIFDLATFFDDANIAPQPLRFEPNVTLDAGGSRRSAIIEISMNNGVDWQIYAGSSFLTTGRAAVYFNDATLDSAFLTAALAGDARVRLTAGLRSPSPVTIARWNGNPFAGTLPPRVFDVGQAFRFQRVATTSRAYTQVQAGDIPADEIDDTAPMTQWIIRTNSINPIITTPATAVLPGAWPMLRPGDRLLDTQPTNNPFDAHFQPWQTLGGIIQSIDVRYNHNGVSTHIDVSMNTGEIPRGDT